MRVLVAGRNAKVLATAAGTFANDLVIETAATKAASIALLERRQFDLIIACETLGDGGSGLEVLSHVAVNTPNTLRIFAARPSTLNLLKGELGLFGLFRTLAYPINFRKLWASLNLARSCQVEAEPPAKKPAVRHVVLDSNWRVDGATPTPSPLPLPQRRALAAARTGASAAARPNASGTARPNASGTARPNAPGTARPNAPAAARHNAPATARHNASAAVGARPIVAGPARAGTSTQVPPPRRTASTAARTPPRNTRIPESDAFRRALAKRNAAKLDSNTHISAADLARASQQTIAADNRGRRRREPGVTSESLAQLARLTTTRKPTYRIAAGGKNRAALFVGSGVFAAATAAVLTFFMLNANNSIGHTSLPLVASIDRPVPRNVLPWQQEPATQPHPARTTFIQNEAVVPAATDMEVEAEAQSDASEIEPGHPGPPPPYTPPGPSEPPAVDYTGMPPEE